MPARIYLSDMLDVRMLPKGIANLQSKPLELAEVRELLDEHCAEMCFVSRRPDRQAMWGFLRFLRGGFVGMAEPRRLRKGEAVIIVSFAPQWLTSRPQDRWGEIQARFMLVEVIESDL